MECKKKSTARRRVRTGQLSQLLIDVVEGRCALRVVDERACPRDVLAHEHAGILEVLARIGVNDSRWQFRRPGGCVSGKVRVDRWLRNVANPLVLGMPSLLDDE